MAANPMAGMGGDPGDENDSGLAACEQKISDLDARVSALEQKAGLGAPVAKPAMGAAMPFFGASK